MCHYRSQRVSQTDEVPTQIRNFPSYQLHKTPLAMYRVSTQKQDSRIVWLIWDLLSKLSSFFNKKLILCHHQFRRAQFLSLSTTDELGWLQKVLVGMTLYSQWKVVFMCRTNLLFKKHKFSCWWGEDASPHPPLEPPLSNTTGQWYWLIYISLKITFKKICTWL